MEIREYFLWGAGGGVDRGDFEGVGGGQGVSVFEKCG